jgi:predicted ribosomally synthesized peptide with SipW-like signal peptide
VRAAERAHHRLQNSQEETPMLRRNGLLILGVIVLLAIGIMGAYAGFYDTETAAENSLVAGTLDLTVNDENDPITQHFEVSDIAPGYDSGYMVWCLKNVGSIPGQPSVEFSAITNDENGTTEPEDEAELEAYASTEGELGQYLKPTIGFAKCSWSVPSRLYGIWQAGPEHPWGIPGVNGLGGNTYFGTAGTGGGTFPVLNQDETIGFFMKVVLDEDLQLWDGTQWVDMNDNLIQSDGVSFDIIFHLDQATP